MSDIAIVGALLGLLAGLNGCVSVSYHQRTLRVEQDKNTVCNGALETEKRKVDDLLLLAREKSTPKKRETDAEIKWEK